MFLPIYDIELAKSSQNQKVTTNAQKQSSKKVKKPFRQKVASVQKCKQLLNERYHFFGREIVSAARVPQPAE
jgi:hypothetical protein